MRWKATCAYDGTSFYGWQSQVSENTIEGIIAARLSKILKKPIKISGSGRTDAGVHAKGQVFHFDTEWTHGKERLMRALNSDLPESIRVVAMVPVKETFHARYSAKRKRYIYRVYEGYVDPMNVRYCTPVGGLLDILAMQKAATYLIGKHDFTAFSASRRDGKKLDSVREIYKIDMVRWGRNIKIVMEGEGFLYKMARSIAGALIEVGLGKMSPSQVKAILKSKQRSEVVVTAPAKGLFLDKVLY